MRSYTFGSHPFCLILPIIAFNESRETGEAIAPETPFVWDGDQNVTELPLPDDVFFQGINCISINNEDDVFVGGNIGSPSYWKSGEINQLETKYGEVWQITFAQTDVYAVGFYIKSNSNSTGHTACYWKNDQLVELEDNAIAYGIFIDELTNDIYVSGASGDVPARYKACFWKNGQRMDLPFNK